jgi:lysophospholipase L1-like esterase
LEFADGQIETYETRFSLLSPEAGGKILIRRETTKISPCISRRKSQLPSLFVVSDSTAFSNGQHQLGWGDPLAKLFDPEKINVRNRARPGRSTRSFRSEGLWSRALAEMKAGDFVLIQFGHNDADKLAEGRCRGVLPGVGGQTQEVVMPDGTHEIVRTYGWYLRQFIAETKAKGATPILLSLTVKNLWANVRLQRNQSEYAHWAAQVAQAADADFIDLNQIIADRYDELGREKVQPLFCSASDNVHTSPAGAELNAGCVAAGLKQLAKSPFTNFLLP